MEAVSQNKKLKQRVAQLESEVGSHAAESKASLEKVFRCLNNNE